MKDWISILLNSIIPLAAILLTWWLNTKRLDEIHVLVNARLQTALNEIAALKRFIASNTQTKTAVRGRGRTKKS